MKKSGNPGRPFPGRPGMNPLVIMIYSRHAEFISIYRYVNFEVLVYSN